MKSLKFSYFSLYLSGFLQFFEKFLQKSLEVIKKYLPLQSQTKRMGHKRGSSSVGRAQPCQGWGREFEPRLPLQKKKSAEMLTYFLKQSLRTVLSFGSRIFTRRGSIICQSSLCTRSAFLFYQNHYKTGGA